MATIWTETFTCVSSFLAHICFVLGLHGGSQECHLVHGPFYCEHDDVVLLVDCWRSVCDIFGHGSNDIINVSPPYALFCCFQLCEFFCIAQP